jgi:hypothetical protein
MKIEEKEIRKQPCGSCSRFNLINEFGDGHCDFVETSVDFTTQIECNQYEYTDRIFELIKCEQPTERC